MKQYQVISTIEEHIPLNDDTWEMSFIAKEITSQALPGQFVHICIPDCSEPFLRRPFGIARIDRKTGMLSLVYKVLGKGTQRLTELKAGDKIDCMGPLGKGYKIEGKKPLVVGGGMGIAPLIYLIDELETKYTPLRILLGARNKNEMFWDRYVTSDNLDVDISTDDGSVGKKGYVSEALKETLKEGGFDQIYTCGPEPLLKVVADIAQAHDIPCQVSLERHMACAVGACLSCTIETTEGSRKKVCMDGPVFKSTEVF